MSGKNEKIIDFCNNYMAAPEGNKNAVGHSQGKGGKTLNDRKLSSEVRTLTLKEIKKVLKAGRSDELFNPVLLKLAGTVLPRLNEHSGPDGESINLTGLFNAE